MGAKIRAMRLRACIEASGNFFGTLVPRPLLTIGAWLNPTNTPVLRYRAEFGRSRSNRMGVNMEPHPPFLGEGAGPRPLRWRRV